MIPLDCTAVSCTARYPKSISFSGCPMAQSAPPPPSWPLSVPATTYPRRKGSAKGAVLMAPAQPPLPSCRYLPFQAEAVGSQRANLILESLLGRMTPRTSQWAGTVPGPAGGAPGAAGAGAAASGTVVAAVMSVYGSFRFTRFSHACCAYTAWLLNRNAAGMSHETLVSTLSPLADLRSAPHQLHGRASAPPRSSRAS